MRTVAAHTGSEPFIVPDVKLKYFDLLRDPARRDPRGYIIPATQADFPTATKFVNALIKTGVTVHRAIARSIRGTRHSDLEA